LLALEYRVQAALNEGLKKSESESAGWRREENMEAGGVVLNPRSHFCIVQGRDFAAAFGWEQGRQRLRIGENGFCESARGVKAIVLAREPRLRLGTGLAYLETPLAEKEGVDCL